MLDYREFRKFLTQNCQVESGDKILVGVSGGSDSMALLGMFSHCKNQIYVAHCNFQLRGKESDDDEQFVHNYCSENELPYFVKRFDTKLYSDENHISIEMAARELRYGWFQELCEDHKLNWIAVGHHSDDNIETFFINLLRGSGVKGLSGMQPVNGNIIRPLLFSTRDEVLDYCHQNNIAYRTDSTNLDSSIIRNKIRHEVIPLFKSINPSFINTMKENMGLINEAGSFIEGVIETSMSDLIIEEDGVALIPIRVLNNFQSRQIVLHALLKDKGFNSSQIHDIVNTLDSESGKQFFSDSYRLVKDRYNLILIPRSQSDSNNFYIEENVKKIDHPFSMNLREIMVDGDFKFSSDRRCVHINADLLDYPLTVRKWRIGDLFRPLGMRNFKKLSDFFIDEKLSVIDKENTWLLTNNEDIVWIIGHRLDDRYKITANTHKVLEIAI